MLAAVSPKRSTPRVVATPNIGIAASEKKYRKQTGEEFDL